MNYTLFFLICASATLILSIVAICVAPIVNGFLTTIEPYSGDEIDVGLLNCKLYSDDYDYYKKKYNNPTESQKIKSEQMKKGINRCKRGKVMHGLEYASLTCDVILGGICAILGLLHYLEVGKTIESKSGLFGVITGTIGFIITIIYIIFSAYIFNNDNNGLVKKLFPNRASLKWNGYQYVPPYDMYEAEDNPDITLATYSELGKKQYNYDSSLFKSLKDTTQNNYAYDCIDVAEEGDKSKIGECLYVWDNDNLDIDSSHEIKNKYIYDRWITTIILSVFIVVCNIGLILFGFLLFKNLGDSSGSVPIPMTSVNALENK